ncbi:MAG: glutathione S-transferase C-terminal domain-containing protein [Aerococcus sp.]|nr:glutathione S-transferase C-terminal domain-containing protein [Aerococcus sp.]
MTNTLDQQVDYPVEANRYHLLAAYPCPFAHRAMIVRELMGLDDAVSIGIANSIKYEQYWGFKDAIGSVDDKDAVLGISNLSEPYLKGDPDYTGPYSVPALVDTHSGTVVNSESLDIIRDFATRFKTIAKADAPDLYPAGEEKEIEEWFSYVGTKVLGPGIRATHSKKQGVYDVAYEMIFSALDALEEHFATHEFLMGDHLTLADVVMYTPLARFDVVFYPVGSLNKKHLYEYPNLWRYTRQLYQMPAFKHTTHFKEIQKGFYLGKSSEVIYSREVLPAGPDLSRWEEPVSGQ